MRQVFTSARLENVEAVARLLEDAGIETRIIHGRSFNKGIRGDFSYREQADEKKPAVWIVKSADQPRARQMLREAGLMDSSRNAAGSFAAMSYHGAAPTEPRDKERSRMRRAMRIKMGLLAAIAVVVALSWMNMRASRRAAAQAAAALPAAAHARIPEDLPGAGNTPTPDSLALALLNGELPTRADAVVCLAIDGNDATPALLAALPPSPGKVLPVSQCPAVATGKNALAPQIIAIGKYEANAKGTGTIFINRRRIGGKGVPQWYDVRRDGAGWRIIQPL